MKTIRRICTSLVVLFVTALAQTPILNDPLLDHLTGNWVLHGTIAGHETTHDIQSEWVLAHQYIRIHEVSRDKNPAGQAAYEAIVFIGWDAATTEYSCLWLDSTAAGGLSARLFRQYR